MTKIQEELKGLYPEENLSETDVQNMTEDLKRFFTLCLEISEQETSPQTVQGNKQKIVQNTNYMG